MEKKKRDWAYFGTRGAWPLEGFEERHELRWLMF